MALTISKEFWEDQQWGFQHHTQFLPKYKDQWIAISDKRIVSSGPNLGAVKEEAKRITKKKEIPVMFVECGAHIY